MPDQRDHQPVAVVPEQLDLPQPGVQGRAAAGSTARASARRLQDRRPHVPRVHVRRERGSEGAVRPVEVGWLYWAPVVIEVSRRHEYYEKRKQIVCVLLVKVLKDKRIS